MAVTRSFYSGLHMLVRLAGLTGLLAVVVGIFWKLLFGSEAWAGEPNRPNPEVGMIIALAGGGAVALALVFELRAAWRFFFSGRGAMGSNVLVQVILAMLIVSGLNVFSFLHYQRFDWTENKAFTLKKELREQLGRLRAETDIVVFVRHSAASLSGESKQDNYDAAAERKIVERVKDLADQFQELGPRFRVQVLDIQEDGYEKKLETIKGASPALAEAIEKAPENSVFFQTHGGGQVQRLAFHDIYQLDRKASLADNRGRGNLVLVSQGVEPFSRKVLNIEEKKPRIGVAVVHEYLGIDGIREFGMPGVKKVLTTRGYEYQDIILKTWRPRLEPTVLTHEENKFERLEGLLRNLDGLITDLKDDRQELGKDETVLRSKSLREVNKAFALVETIRGATIIDRSYVEGLVKKGVAPPPMKDLTEEDRQEYLQFVQETLESVDKKLQKTERRREQLALEKTKLNIENLTEQRRITDLRAKFTRQLADCDLLILPRLTLINLLLGGGHRLEPEVHSLDAAQVEAIKDYLKSGRPALFCLGPVNEPFEKEAPRDEIENLLASLGVELPNETILFSVEAEALAERGAGQEFREGSPVEPPPVDLDSPTGWSLGKGQRADAAAQSSSPIRTSMRITGRGFGLDNPALLRVRHPRPVYYLRMHIPKEGVAAALPAFSSAAGLGPLNGVALLLGKSSRRIDESAVFLVTSDDSWNTDKPFAATKPPKIERAKPSDQERGSLREKRTGPFPIGVAFETALPASWTEGGEAAPGSAKVRVAVVGNGGVFMGETLGSMQEKLLLDVSNWLLGRDDLLARDDPQPWKYPRVEVADREAALWTWAACLGLPLFFVYIGVMIWLVRGVR